MSQKFTAIFLLSLFFSNLAWAQKTTLVSVSQSGEIGNGPSLEPTISKNGRYILFESQADNLDPQNAGTNLYLHDRLFGFTRAMGMGLAVGGGNLGHVESPSISPDGRLIAFWSRSSNLVEGDQNEEWDVFVLDRDPDKNFILDEGNELIRRVSVDSQGNESTGDPICCAVSHFVPPRISDNGVFVTFQSGKTGLVENDTNDISDVFVHNLEAGVTSRASLDSEGNQLIVLSTHNPEKAGSALPSISSDGRYISFASLAESLNPHGYFRPYVYVRDRDPDGNGIYDEGNGTTEMVSFLPDSQDVSSMHESSISADGRYVAMRGGFVYVRDRMAQRTILVSVNENNEPANATCQSVSISDDGRFVLFHTYADNLVPDDTNPLYDVFLSDLDPDGNGILDEGNKKLSMVNRDDSGNQIAYCPTNATKPQISGDGRQVVFTSGEPISACQVFVRGNHLTLESNLDSVSAAGGDLLTLSTWKASYFDPAVLVITDFNRDSVHMPLFFLVTEGRFDPTGNFISSLAIPPLPGFLGASLSFQTFGLVEQTGQIEVSNKIEVSFE